MVAKHAARSELDELRLLVLAETLGGTGGIQRSTLEVSRELHALGLEIHLAYAEGGELLSDWRGVASDLIELGSTLLPRSEPVRSRARRRKAAKFARGREIGIVYSHSPRQIELGYRTARSAGAAYVHHARTSPPANPALQGMIRQANALISVSQSTLDEWIEHGAVPLHTFVVPNGVDLTVFHDISDTERVQVRATHRIDADSFLVGYFGRVSRRKGVQDLLEAFGNLRGASAAHVELIVVGALDNSPQSRAPGQTVVGLDGAGVTSVGHVDRVAPLMAACDVVVVPSHYEPFGRVAIEALACGTAVLASSVGGLTDILQGSLGRHLFEPENATDLTRALLDVIDCPPNRKEMQERARHFSLGSTAAGVLEALTFASKGMGST